MATFYSPRQNPVQNRPIGFSDVARAYTLKRIVGYWETAVAHIQRLGTTNKGEPWYRQARQIVDQGKRDLAAINRGEHPVS